MTSRQTLQWRHNEPDGILNHRRLIVYSTVCSGADQRKHQSSASLTFAGNSPVTGEFPAQRASNAENVSIWWRHHALGTGNAGIYGNTGHNCCRWWLFTILWSCIDWLLNWGSSKKRKWNFKQSKKTILPVKCSSFCFFVFVTSTTHEACNVVLFS